MGTPRVFQTAPPQPASKARMTWSPQLAGGPEASQNGLGQRIPAKFTEMSGMRDQPGGGAFAVGHCGYYFAASVGYIASCVKLWIACTARGAIDCDYSSL